jgi:undecaprenyl-diphosphatase
MRIRPFDALGILNLVNESDSSFPSGHAAAVFSTVYILDREFPKIKWFWIGIAILVSFSRIYLGVHYLTDVVVGALIGYTISLIVVKYRDKLVGRN